jgi:hypothetical protein
MVASGSLIMDVSSVLSLKFPDLSAVYMDTSFEGMFFSDGTDTINYLKRDSGPTTTGATTSMTSVASLSTGVNAPATSAFAAKKNGVVTFFRFKANTIYEYIATSSVHYTSYTFGSGYGACTDGTYMYNISSGNTTHVNRRHIETGVSTNFTTTSTVQGQSDNQGSFLAYHDGHLYTKQTGTNANMYIIKISDGSVEIVTGGVLAGGYSDGGCVVTSKHGVSYIVEQGTSQWQWYEIGGAATTFTKETGASSASTEFGNGAVQVAPGIAFIFCEASDDLTIIDMNPSPPVWEHIGSASDRNAAVTNSFGTYIGVCGLLSDPGLALSHTYDAYTSGVLITEDV